VDGSDISKEIGIGTPGLNGAFVYTARLSRWPNILGGPLENATTPMYSGSAFYSQGSSSGGQAMSLSLAGNSSSRSSGGPSSASINSASASVAAAKAAISRGDYKAASAHLQSASKALK
jgi:hypothetical protein